MKLDRKLMLIGVAALLFSPESVVWAQQPGGAGVTGGGATGGTNTRTAQTATNRTDAGAVDTAAGTSDQILRDFGDGLVGRGDTATRFVGNQAASTQTGQVQAPGNFQNLNRQRAQQSQPTGNPIRPRLVIGFDTRMLAASGASLAVPEATSKALVSVIPGVGYQVSSEGVATLTGRVETERASKLAEAIVRLEPGIRKVENQLSVMSVTPPRP